MIRSAFIILSFLYSVSTFSQSTLTFTSYYEVDGDTIKADQKGQVIKEKYTVLKGPKKIKHGTYTRYSKLSAVLERGTYANGEKTGIWTNYSDNGLVAVRYDHDRDSAYAPLILIDEIFIYPRKLVVEIGEKGGALPEGDVVLSPVFDKSCLLTGCTVKESSNKIFNNYAIEAYKTYTALRLKYNQPIEECRDKKPRFRVEYKP